MPFREDYNMLVSHSPPVFSHSPPTTFSSFHHHPRTAAAFDTFGARVLNAHCRTTLATQHKKTNSHFGPCLTSSSSPMTIPRRGCLVVRTGFQHNEEELLMDDELMFSPARRDKKKVVFADDKGMELTQIRVMTEPSNVPPVWSLRFLAQVTQGMSAEPTVVHEPWEITFSQPAAEYLEFRKRLDTLKVSLENVIVKDVEQAIVGTIKVCNIAFDKEVFIRYTSDGWSTHNDQLCNFVGNGTSSVNNNGTATTLGTHSMYDTFSFRLEMPSDSRNIEFCVCYRCDCTEFWDNNGTTNYSVVKKVVRAKYGKMAASQNKMAPGNRPMGGGDDKVSVTQKSVDIFQAKVDSWSEFASWSQLENVNPYW